MGALRDELTVLDALDQATSEVVEECSYLLPLQDKTAALNLASLDFQWLTGNIHLNAFLFDLLMININAYLLLCIFYKLIKSR